ncbi:TPA: NUDIX domain-containing protein [Candidatus Woesearchaeota archaeon]|nr:NUDIX domain-containing protein [Candidatus Woesearchaeota archaeon]
MAHKAVRVVIFRGDKLLVIHRHREGEEFFVLPGGTIEEGESLEETAVREAKEETDLDVRIVEELFTITQTRNGKIDTTHFFIVDASAGTPRLVAGPELLAMSETNRYDLEWHTLDSLEGKNFYPSGVYAGLEKRFGKK